jgi:hypothetical protein
MGCRFAVLIPSLDIGEQLLSPTHAQVFVMSESPSMTRFQSLPVGWAALTAPLILCYQ